jgi:hypothetical protein
VKAARKVLENSSFATSVGGPESVPYLPVS